MWYKNIAGRFFRLVTKHACDRRTDGQNYDSQDCASIAASRGKNHATHSTACKIEIQNTANQMAASVNPVTTLVLLYEVLFDLSIYTSSLEDSKSICYLLKSKNFVRSWN